MLEKVARMNDLYDFYGPLLTEKQQKIFELYYQEDWSLGEIAETENTTRQAVYDLLRRVGAILEEYDAKLSLVEKNTHIRAALEEALVNVEEVKREQKPLPLEELKKHLLKILQEL